jgi:hypothetical protein
VIRDLENDMRWSTSSFATIINSRDFFVSIPTKSEANSIKYTELTIIKFTAKVASCVMFIKHDCRG